MKQKIKTLVTYSLICLGIATTFWLFFYWWPTGYTPFSRVGGEG